MSDVAALIWMMVRYAKSLNNFTIEVILGCNHCVRNVQNERIHLYIYQTIILGKRRGTYLRPSLVQRHQPLQ